MDSKVASLEPIQLSKPEMVIMCEEHREKFIELLSKTYFDDPVVIWYFPDEKTRKQKLRSYMEVAFNFSNRFCSSYVTLPGVIGAVVIMKPQTYISPLLQILSGVPSLIYKLGPSAFFKFVIHTKFIEKVRDEVIPEPHWRGCFFGVDPDYRHLGISEQLATFIRRQADLTQKPLYVETARPEIVKIYKHFGFKLLKEIQVPQGGPRMWLLIRTPRPIS